MRTRLVCAMSLALAVSTAPALPVAADARPQLSDAFAAVFGHATPVTRVVSRPNPPCCRTVILTVTPGDLVDLGQGRYALIALETNAAGSHAEPGAISIAYLDRRAGGWRLQREWREFAWIGDSGHAADRFQNLTSPPNATSSAAPIAFAIKQGVWQGEAFVTAWAIVLSPGGPRLAGHVSAGGELMADNGCDLATCGAWRYAATIQRPTAPGALFSVAYRGWRQAPGRRRRTPIRAVTNYVERKGALVAEPPVKLPDA
jgi:hypothetical protein